MVAPSAKRSSTAPWVVLIQGSTTLSYDDQTLLDQLEYQLRVGGPALGRFLEDDANVSGISVRLYIAIYLPCSV